MQALPVINPLTIKKALTIEQRDIYQAYIVFNSNLPEWRTLMRAFCSYVLEAVEVPSFGLRLSSPPLLM